MKTLLKIILLLLLLRPFFSYSQTIAGGDDHSLVICTDSTVWSWGRNLSGQLGDASTLPRLTPVQVHGPGNVGFLTGITSIAAGTGGAHSMALKKDSTVWAWGSNIYGQLGVNTSGVGADSLFPVQVHGTGNVGFLTGITSISLGGAHSIALKKDSTVWDWGYNGYGQLGINSVVSPQPTPVKVRTGASGCAVYLCNITAIAGGQFFSLALKSDGTVWAWGMNGSGQLGDGTTTTRRIPVQVVAGASGCGTYLCNIIAIEAGRDYTLALKSDGTVWAWGMNVNGQFGDNTTTGSLTPVQVHGPGNVGFLTGITAIAAGFGHSLALKSDSTVWSWGQNINGHLGDGTFINRITPVQVVTGTSGCASYLCSITQVAVGGNHSMALKKDGTLWDWGYNGYGQLGDGTSTNISSPISPALCTVKALPVEMLYFNAVAENNSLVRCYWSTATEINNDYFAVERSQYGINFEQIGTVKGAGNSSTTTLNYTFYDEHPYTGISYYRLKQFDYNGTFTYSQIRAVYIGTLNLITIYPNPSTDGSIQYIIASEDGGELSVKVYDIIGRKVISNTEMLEGGVSTKKLSTAGLSSGSYLLQITNGNLEKTQKQFVIR